MSGGDRASSLALALALPSLTLLVLRPPELAPAGRLAFGLLAATGALLFAWRPVFCGAGSGRAAALLLPLMVATLLAAPCRARALDEAAQLGAVILIGLLGFTAAREKRSWGLVPLILVALASAVALQAVVQAHWLYPRQAAVLRAAGDPAADNAIVRLEAGRPAGPFLLPSSLAGFLALALPATILLVRRASWRRGRLFGIAAALLQVYALALTRSLGGLAAAAAGLLLILPALAARRRIAFGFLVAFAALALGGLFLHQRRAEIASAPGGDPLQLRAGNWQAAARMIEDRPLVGVGPGSFGTAYPRYLRAGMNETRYAHNSYLQAAACWGVWILAPITALLLGFLKATHRRARDVDVAAVDAGMRLALAAGAATFLLHNLIDFTLYLPGIAGPAALLVGMTLASGSAPVGAASGIRSGSRLAALAAAALIAWNALVAGRAETRMESARRAAEAGDVAQAEAQARGAAAARPGSPDPWAFLAQLVLAHHMDDPALREEGRRAADRAVRLDPESAVLHHTRALFLAAAGEKAPAYLELARAHRLYPLKEAYRLKDAPEESP